MAKKLKWRDPKKEQPPALKNDPDRSAGGRYSERVLILTNRKPERYVTNAEYTFGRYSHAAKEWLFESGYGPDLKCIAWAYLKKP